MGPRERRAAAGDGPAERHDGRRALARTATWIWWFDDKDGDEFGVWRRQPFGGGPDEPAVPGLDALLPGRAGARPATGGRRWSAGRRTRTARRSTSPAAGEAPVEIYRHRESAGVGDLSHDGSLIAIEHTEHGDAMHSALRVLRPDGTTVADLDDTRGGTEELGLEVLGFAPVDGDTRLLIGHQRRGRWEPLVWDVATRRGDGPPAGPARRRGRRVVPGRLRAADRAQLRGPQRAVPLRPGHARAGPHPHPARHRLRGDGPPGRQRGVPVVLGRRAAGGPLHTRRGRPGPARPEVPAVGAGGGRVGGRPRRPHPRPRPEARRRHGPLPTVFDLHGGPTWHDSDSFAAGPAAWVDHGYAVVRVNYRGSTGYGRAWTDALKHRVGPDRAGGRRRGAGVGGLLRPRRPRAPGPHRRLLGRLPHPPRHRHPAGGVDGGHRGGAGRGLRHRVPRRDGGAEGHGPHPPGRHPRGGPGPLRGVLAR